MRESVESRYTHIVSEPSSGPADARVQGTGMHVWEIAWTARHYADLDAMARSLNPDRDLLEEGMRYAGEHQTEVEAAIEENESWTFERLQEVLPGIQLFSPDLGATPDENS